ncbi:MAG: hypothetical protein HFF02_09865, partial [Erysipelotrichaceae bacterium]|nr:hypothetical protein [Erysipelotrichaceae bacterium]
MKKKLCILICFFVCVVIGIPMYNVIPNMVRANSDVPPGEAAIDVEFGVTWSSTRYVYAVTDEGNLFLYDEWYHARWVPMTETATSFRMPSGGKLLDNIVKVSSTANENVDKHNVMALRSDGSIYVWGSNQYGQFGNGVTNDEILTTPVLIQPNVP